jgi:hypothetical protein
VRGNRLRSRGQTTGGQEIMRSGVFFRDHPPRLLNSLSLVAVAEMERCLCSACGERQPAAIRGTNDRRSGDHEIRSFSEILLLDS